VDTENVKMGINPFDEIALEEAVRIKEKNPETTVISISVGKNSIQDVLRSSLAFGADRSILVETDLDLGPLQIAKVLCNIVESEEPDLILMGKQAIDDDCNQTGQMLAGILGWPQATFISKIDLRDKEVFLKREVDSGVEELKTTLPCVVTVDLRLNNPRFISLPNIIKAKKKEIKVIDAKELNIDLERKTKIIEINEPEQREKGEIIQDVDELIDCLKKSGVLNK
jgi:electron transfer flavoprotein beta subunit